MTHAFPDPRRGNDQTLCAGDCARAGCDQHHDHGRARDRACRPGRGGQDHPAAADRGASQGRWRQSGGLRSRSCPGRAGTASPPGLHAATLWPLRRSDGAGKSDPLRRSARRRGARARPHFRAAFVLYRAWSFHDAAGGQAVGRHEAKARPRLRADRQARIAVAGRTERRRRSDLAPRIVANGLRTGRSGHRRGLEHGLSRRGRTLRRGDLAQRRAGSLSGTAT